MRGVWGIMLGGMLGALAAPASGRPAPVPCPEGRFFVPARRSPLIPGDPFGGFDIIFLADGQAAIASGCDPVAAELKATRRSTRVRVEWASCLGLTGTVRLRGRIDGATCTRLAVTLRAPASRFHRRVVATRSVCGDGIVDGPLGETCDPPGAGLCDASCHTIPQGSPSGAFVEG